MNRISALTIPPWTVTNDELAWEVIEDELLGIIFAF
jgi:hypothetical protein